MVKISYADSPEHNNVFIERGEHLIEVNLTHEGIFIEVYRDNGNVYSGCYTGVTYDEIIGEVIVSEREPEPAPAATTPSTEYYIGDPCYVLSDTDYAQLCEMIEQFGHGYLVVNGKRVWAQSTYYGDGVYALRDSLNHEVASLAVDSGMLAAIPLELLRDDTAEYVVNYGFTADLGVEFDCSYDAETGKMRFGTYSVRTGE